MDYIKSVSEWNEAYEVVPLSQDRDSSNETTTKQFLITWTLLDCQMLILQQINALS